METKLSFFLYIFIFSVDEIAQQLVNEVVNYATLNIYDEHGVLDTSHVPAMDAYNPILEMIHSTSMKMQHMYAHSPGDLKYVACVQLMLFCRLKEAQSK